MTRVEERTAELLETGLPEGWTLCQLGELGSWSSGGTPSKANDTFWKIGTIPWVSPKDLKSPVIADSLDHITSEAVAAARLRLLPPGSLLFVVRGMILARAFPVARTVTTVTINQDMRSLVPSPGVDVGYLVLALQQQEIPILHAVKEATHGTLRLDSEDLQAWPIPLPPLAEQRRIVAKAEELLARVNAARERLSRVPAILKRFRQSVLAAACSARLTSDWREDNPQSEPAATALERCQSQMKVVEIHKKLRRRGTEGLPDVDLPDELPNTWALRTVRQLVESGAILDFQDGNHGELYPRSSDFGDTGVRFLTAAQVFDNRVFIDQASFLREEKASQLRIGFARSGDVLLTHNATVGRVAIMPETSGEVILGTSVTYYRLNRSFFDPCYCCFAMQGELWQSQLRSVMEQTTRNQVSITKQVEFWLPIPPLPEQHEIARRVGTLFALADAIEKRVAATTLRVEKLTQAILAKAFRGELVPTEAEVARQEGRDYEPASALLERIRKESDKEAEGKKPRRRPGR